MEVVTKVRLPGVVARPVALAPTDLIATQTGVVPGCVAEDSGGDEEGIAVTTET